MNRATIMTRTTTLFGTKIPMTLFPQTLNSGGIMPRFPDISSSDTPPRKANITVPLVRSLGRALWLVSALSLTAFLAPSAAQAADLIIDNGTAQFSTVGTWPTSTAVAGYEGTNYQTHEANGPIPGALTVDNRDAGFSVTGEWPDSTAIAGYYGTNYRTHEANGAKPGSLVIDNSNGVALGSWPISTAVAGYLGANYQPHAAGIGENRFTWPLAGNGSYRVYAKWTAHPNRATNAPYTIRHSVGETTVTVNQQQNGGKWQLLGTYILDANSQMTLSDAANGYVIADAVMAEPENAKANTATWQLPVSIVKNYRVYARWSANPNRATNARYTISHSTGNTNVTVNQQQNGGQWQLLGTYALNLSSRISLSDEADGYVIADAVMAVPEDAPSANSVTWTPSLGRAGRYEVYAKWTAHPNRATNAHYTISHSTGDTIVTVNQQQNGGQWQLLGTYALNLSSRISLSDDADGYVIADAIRLSDVGPADAKLYYLHTDHLNTPRLVTDETNTIVWRNSPLTEPFGLSPVEEDPDGDGKPFTMNLRFPGQYADKETNLNYNYYRDYNPQTGRYIQSDPIGLNGGINTFGYVGGNPLSKIDPMGLDTTVVPGQGTAGAIGDFFRNYQNMRDANTIGGDKYFHCKANCEATKRGKEGERAACVISDTREWVDQNIKGDPASASEADQVANRYGRNQGSSSSQSCSQICAPFRPNGLPSKY